MTQKLGALTISETQRLLGSGRPISIGNVPTDPIGMRMTPSIVSERLVNRSVELHRCKVCGTRWLLWPDALHGGGWNLLDKYQRPGACCNNAAMGDQIEHLRDLPLGVVPAPAPQPQEEWTEAEAAAAHADFKTWNGIRIRLRKLASEAAFDRHEGARAARMPGHTADFEDCPHVDCVLVRGEQKHVADSSDSGSSDCSDSAGSASRSPKRGQPSSLVDEIAGVVPAPAPQEEQEASPSSCVVGYRVENDDDGDWHILVFGDGVQRRIFTRNPLVIVQPERH